MMPTFQYKKLVRNNIWQWHEDEGHIVDGIRLKGNALKQSLAEKLHEESDEVATADTRENLVEEIADVEQILENLRALESITDEEVEAAIRKKRDKKGDFSEGAYIHTVTMPNENDEWVSYCRTDPLKYPEVQPGGHIDPALPALEKGTYRHAKSGQMYEVLGVACNTETNQPLVIYRPLYDSKYEFFARPYENFTAPVTIDSNKVMRFEIIDAVAN